jgi:hypothetical protein
MQWITLFGPAFIACAIQQKLDNRKFTGCELLQAWALYTFFINFTGLVVYQYILKTPNSFMDNFVHNTFIVHYMLMSIVLAVIFALLRQSVKPHISLRLEKKEKQEKSTNEEC